MTLSWFILFMCIFGAFGIERLPRRTGNRQAHPSLKIINGKTTSVSTYPFIASLQILQGEFGAAVILAPYYLLTTAFNVAWTPLENIQFRVGSDSYSKDGQVLNAAEVHVHPNFTGSWDYDIAVIKTDKEIVMGDKVKSIKMATKNINKKTKAQVIGWGETTYDSVGPKDTLYKGDVTIIAWNQCAKSYNTSDLTPRLMCTMDKTQGPCVYDYGDPLVVKNVLYGLFAGGYNCKPGTYPVLYTNVFQLSSWVNSIISP